MIHFKPKPSWPGPMDQTWAWDEAKKQGFWVDPSGELHLSECILLDFTTDGDWERFEDPDLQLAEGL